MINRSTAPEFISPTNSRNDCSWLTGEASAEADT